MRHRKTYEYSQLHFAMKPTLILLTTLLLAPPLLVSAAEPPKVETSELVVVEKGKPMCAIFMEPGAPKSVRLAADEIQRVIRLATGSSLPVITEARPPMICLGDCAAARAAGVAVEAMVSNRHAWSFSIHRWKRHGGWSDNTAGRFEQGYLVWRVCVSGTGRRSALDHAGRTGGNHPAS